MKIIKLNREVPKRIAKILKENTEMDKEKELSHLLQLNAYINNNFNTIISIK